MCVYVCVWLRASHSSRPATDDRGRSQARFKFPTLSDDTVQLLWRKHAELNALLPELKQKAAHEGRHGRRYSSSAAAATDSADATKRRHPRRRTSVSAGHDAADDAGRDRAAAADQRLVGFDGWLLGAGGDNARKLLHASAPSVQKAQLALLKQAFDRFDRRSIGRVTADDVAAGLAATGRDASAPAVDRWMKEHDRNNTGAVTFTECVACVCVCVCVSVCFCVSVADTAGVGAQVCRAVQGSVPSPPAHAGHTLAGRRRRGGVG